MSSLPYTPPQGLPTGQEAQTAAPKLVFSTEPSGVSYVEFTLEWGKTYRILFSIDFSGPEDILVTVNGDTSSDYHAMIVSTVVYRQLTATGATATQSAYVASASATYWWVVSNSSSVAGNPGSAAGEIIVTPITYGIVPSASATVTQRPTLYMEYRGLMQITPSIQWLVMRNVCLYTFPAATPPSTYTFRMWWYLPDAVGGYVRVYEL